MNVGPKILEAFARARQKDQARRIKARMLWARMADFFENDLNLSGKETNLTDFPQRKSQEQKSMAAATQNKAAPASMYAKQLAAMRERFNSQKQAAKKGGSDVPNGTYLCRLKKAELRQFDIYDNEKVSEKQLGCLMTWMIVDGEQAGEVLWTKGKFGDDEGILRFLRDLRKLGVDTDNTEVDQPLMDYLTQTKPGARLKHTWQDGSRGQYSTTYLQQGVALGDVSVAVAQDTVAIAEPTEEPSPEPVAAPAKGGNKPAKKAAVEASSDPEPEPEPTATSAEPEPQAEPEPDATIWEAGDTAEFKAQKAVRQGYVLKIEEKGGKTVLVIRENNTTNNWPIPTDFPSLRKVVD